MTRERFRQRRLEYLRLEQPELYQELKDDGVLHAHLKHVQQRALSYFEKLMRSGLCAKEAEEKVCRELISINRS